jgi:hypothetical protein
LLCHPWKRLAVQIRGSFALQAQVEALSNHE